MSDIIIGSEALRDGTVTRHELQHHHRPVFANIHAPKNRILTLRDTTSRRGCGHTATAW